MIIVSGKVYVDPAARDSYLDGCRELIETARRSDGCLDFYLSADPLEDGRINVYEQWESVTAVEAFRGSGPSPEQIAQMLDLQVFQYDIASSHRL